MGLGGAIDTTCHVFNDSMTPATKKKGSSGKKSGGDTPGTPGYFHHDSGVLGFSISEDGTPLIADRHKRGTHKARWQEVKALLLPSFLEENEDDKDATGNFSSLPAFKGGSSDDTSVAATGASIHSEKSLAETIEASKEVCSTTSN